jgi:tetratricopeptide (TPR) repeat protein
LNLRPIAADLESRRKVFEDAFASFAKHFGKKMPVGVTPDLSAAELEDAFYIHAAALLAYRGELDRDLPVQRKQVLELIMKRERLLWNDTVVGHPDLPDALSGEPIEEAATQLTLASLNDGVTRERAVSLLASCANLVGIDAPVLGKIADIFHLLYPGPVSVNGVTPDPVGTFFLSEAADNLVAEAAAKLDGGEAANALTKVNWVAQEWPDSGRRKLALAFAANPEKLLPLTIDVAIESGDPIGQVASEYLAKNASTGLAQRLKPAIPYPTTALRELGEVVESILHDAVSGDDETARAERAARASDLSVRLSDLGRREAALVANEEAAEIYRALAADRPDAFRPNLAASLNNLSAHLSDLGRREEALAANEEAVEIRRALAAERPDAFRPDLAASLGARGAVLRGLERHGEAAESFADALRTLSPQFLDLPQAFAALTQSLVRIYLESIQQAGTQPDTDWLEPVLQKLQDIGAIEVGETDDGEATS